MTEYPSPGGADARSQAISDVESLLAGYMRDAGAAQLSLSVAERLTRPRHETITSQHLHPPTRPRGASRWWGAPGSRWHGVLSGG